MSNFVYVDNSNIWIEGMRASAIEKGLVPDVRSSIELQIVDQSWRLDFGKLYKKLEDTFGELTAARLWGSPPPGDSFWQMVKKSGFDVKTYERSYGKEKKVDTAIVTHVIKDAYTKLNKETDHIILLAGDKDYIPALEELIKDGFKVTVVFWGQAAYEMKQGGHKFHSLNPWLSEISL